MKSIRLLFVSSLLLVLPVTSFAAPITISTDFSFTNVYESTSTGIPAPLEQLSGNFVLTYDPTVDVSDIAVDSFSFDGASAPFSTSNIRFSNADNPLAPAPGMQFLLEIYSTNLEVQFGTPDFLLQFAGFPNDGIPLAGLLLYSVPGALTLYQSNDSTQSTTILTSSVPEPAPAVLLSLAVIGLLRRKIFAKQR